MMEPLSLKEIIRAVNGEIITSGRQDVCASISTDTRTLKKGDTFVALKGDNFDGNDYIGQAVSAGAEIVIVSRKDCTIPAGITAVYVDDTLRALGDIASYYRSRLKCRVIAITGSNGKTTTKEFLKTCLAAKYSVIATEGTKNNLVGVPQTIFRADSSHDYLILELGINQFNEMTRLAQIAQPDMALLTGIAPSHLEYFGDMDGVFRAKSELFHQISADVPVFLNKKDSYYSQSLAVVKGKVKSFGIECDADFCAKHIAIQEKGIEFKLYENGSELGTVLLPFYAEHTVINFLAALAVARECGVNWDAIKNCIGSLSLPAMRMQVFDVSGIRIVNDAYNANPVSTRSALMVFERIPVKGKKVMVFGDMRELGADSERFHKEIGTLIAHSSIDVLVCVGSLARYAAEEVMREGKRTAAYDTVDDACSFVSELLETGDAVLLKGSRANRLEKIAQFLQNNIKPTVA
ncbi:MAG: UDP-N-acetylmuramoyl-tripeptide--D-alanyl-D-alanine ligase [Candidatus Auribacterota bacterium]